MITILKAANVLKPEIDTNDIPRNTTFYGRIYSKTIKEWSERRLWLCVGRYTIDGKTQGPFVISLEPRRDGSMWNDLHYFKSECSPVREYEPVDVTISISPVKNC